MTIGRKIALGFASMMLVALVGAAVSVGSSLNASDRLRPIGFSICRPGTWPWPLSVRCSTRASISYTT